MKREWEYGVVPYSVEPPCGLGQSRASILSGGALAIPRPPLPDGQITRAVDLLCRCTPERKRDTLELQLQHLAFLRCPFRGSRDPNSQLPLRNYWCEVQCTNYVTYSSSFELIGTLESLGAMLHVVPTNYSMDFLFGKSVAGVCIVLLNIRIHVCRSEGEEHSVNNTT